MKTSINLVSQKKKNVRGLGIFNTAAIVCFSLVFVVAVGLLVYTLILNSTSSNLDTQSNQLLSSINQLSSEKLNYLLLKERLTSIQTVFATRTDVNTKLTALLALLPQSLNVTAVETDATHVSITVNSANLAELNTLVEQNLETFIQSPKLGIKKIDMDGFGIDQTGTSYFATLDFQF